MSLSSSIQKTVSLGGKNFIGAKSISGDATIVHEESLAAAVSGTLTTRTDDDTGVVTAGDAGHGITDSHKVDLYWDGGCRRGMTVSSVNGAAITIDAGLGDNLPTQDTVVAIIVPTELDVAVLGTNVKVIALYSEARSQFVFWDSLAEELARELAAGSVWVWDDDDGETNPITGDSIIAVQASHADTDNSKTVRVGILYDND